MILLNAQSLRNKFHAFQSEIVSFYDEPEFIAVTEAWFSEEVPKGMFCFNKYDEYRNARVGQPFGGVLCLVRNDIASEQLQGICDLEIVWIGVYLGNIRFLIGVYYRSSVTNVRELGLLRAELKYMIDRYPRSKLIFCGDLNLPGINWVENLAPKPYRQDEYLELFFRF